MTISAQDPARKGAKILIIDDNGVSRSILRATLRSDGYHDILESSSSHGGLAMVYEHFPDLICLDVSMPGRNGIELLQELKAKLPSLPVLMVTASNDAETVAACVKGNADGYVIKPFNAETLLKAVGLALNKASSRAD